MSSSHSQASPFNSGGHRSSQAAVSHSLPISRQGRHQRQLHSYDLPSSDPNAQPSSSFSSLHTDYVFVLGPSNNDFPSPYDVPFSSSSNSTSSISSVPPSSISSHSDAIHNFENTAAPHIDDSVTTIRAGPSSSNQRETVPISLHTWQTSESDLPLEVGLLDLPRVCRVDINIKPFMKLREKNASSNDTACKYTHLRLPLGARVRSSNDFDSPSPQIIDISTELYCAKDLNTPVIPCERCCKRVRKARAQRTSPSFVVTDESVPIIEFSGPTLVPISEGLAHLRFTINCYCSHHSEDEGFRIQFTLRDYFGEVIGQVTTDPILVIDRRKNKSKGPSDDNHSMEPATPSTTADIDMPMELIGDTDPFKNEDLSSGASSLPSSSTMLPAVHPTIGVSQPINYQPRPIKRQRGGNWNEHWTSPPPAAFYQVPMAQMRANEDTMHAHHEHVDTFQPPRDNPSQITEVNPSRGPAQGGYYAEIHGVNFFRLRLGGFWIAFGNVYYHIDNFSPFASGPVQILSDNLMRCMVPSGTPSTTVSVRFMVGPNPDALQPLGSPTSGAKYFAYTAGASNYHGMPSSGTPSFPSNPFVNQFHLYPY